MRRQVFRAGRLVQPALYCRYTILFEGVWTHGGRSAVGGVSTGCGGYGDETSSDPACHL